MSDHTLTSESIDVIQETVDTVQRMFPFGAKTGILSPEPSSSSNLRGYLLQGVSRGQKALCAITARRPEYRCYKIDLAGIVYTNDPDSESKFQLRFKKDGATWFDTDILTVADLTIGKLLHAISNASMLLGSQNGIQTTKMLGTLGHPFQATHLINNDELYPSLPSTYKLGDYIDSKTGSWLFAIHRDALPVDPIVFDIDLLFTIDAANPVQLVGPAVMTLYEIFDCPTTIILPVTDVFDVASPTPLRPGTKVILSYFDDVGYGITNAYPREYLFEQSSA